MKIIKAVLIEEINRIIQELRFLKPKQESLEWYLLNNLNTYLQSIERADENIKIKNATEIFGMFCTESMNWDTDLYKKCMEITKIDFKLCKQEQLWLYINPYTGLTLRRYQVSAHKFEYSCGQGVKLIAKHKKQT